MNSKNPPLIFSNMVSEPLNPNPNPSSIAAAIVELLQPQPESPEWRIRMCCRFLFSILACLLLVTFRDARVRSGVIASTSASHL